MPDGRPGHEKNWLDAIRQKGQAVSHFDYAGPFTETVLLGNVALRFPGERLMWDAANMKVTNKPEADQYVQHTYRPGWSLGSGASADGSGTSLQLLLSCVPMHRTSTAGSGSRDLASPATFGASRTRP